MEKKTQENAATELTDENVRNRTENDLVTAAEENNEKNAVKNSKSDIAADENNDKTTVEKTEGEIVEEEKNDGKKHKPCKHKAAADYNRTLKLCVISMLCALTAVVTWVLPIPMPATEGYVNFGDTIIFIGAAFMGGIPAMAVGGIGSMLADLFGGYMHWAGFTLVIKGIEGLLCGVIFRGLSKKVNAKISLFIAMFIAAVWMVIGYYFAGALMYGWAGSLASVPGNLMQGGVSIGIAYALSLIFDTIKPLKPFLERIK